jgi:hypothetical protein
MSNQHHYRANIDGLRAIAIIAIIYGGGLITKKLPIDQYLRG